MNFRSLPFHSIHYAFSIALRSDQRVPWTWWVCDAAVRCGSVACHALRGLCGAVRSRAARCSPVRCSLVAWPDKPPCSKRWESGMSVQRRKGSVVLWKGGRVFRHGRCLVFWRQSEGGSESGEGQRVDVCESQDRAGAGRRVLSDGFVWGTWTPRLSGLFKGTGSDT